MLLTIENLSVHFQTRRGIVQAVRDVNLTLARGETLGVVGESGSGKSVSSYALMQILDKGGKIDSGSIHFDGTSLTPGDEQTMREIRGREIAMIFQNPRAALNPIRKVGPQIEDVLKRHNRSAGEQTASAAVELLRTVRIAEPEKRYHAYPFELSGGMCQRILIALALACQPRLLIADEPTTGLDVTTQKVIMDLLSSLTRQRQMATILITHDLGLAAQYCDRIAVMKDGVVIETSSPSNMFRQPEHAYTRRLMRATPRPGATARDLLETPIPALDRPARGGALLEVSRLRKVYGRGQQSVTAVDDVSFTIAQGETLGLVGESGSGKSTVSAMISRLQDPSSGDITMHGKSLLDVSAARFARDPRRTTIQMVFQDATDSLNPRSTAFDAIAEPVRRLSEDAPKSRVPELAEQVGLPRSLLSRLPHQLSGGQKARVGIARALAARPSLLVLDEPTAALDVSIQATVLNLLCDLRASLGMSYLFVSHDLQVVRLLCDRVIVMQKGRLVESGPTAQIMTKPEHAYTQELLAAAPTNDLAA